MGFPWGSSCDCLLRFGQPPSNDAFLPRKCHSLTKKFSSPIARAIKNGEHDSDLAEIDRAIVSRRQSILDKSRSRGFISDLLDEAALNLEDALHEPSVTMRNKRGIEVHAQLEKIKNKISQLPDSNDKDALEARLMMEVRRLLAEIFGLNV